MRKSNEYHMNIGGASIILLIIVFALTIFAILSVRASYHEMKLADKTRESVEAYYNLDFEAECIKNEVSELYMQYIKAGNEPAGFTLGDTGITFENGIVKYKVTDDAENYISVSLKLNADGTVTVTEWRASEKEYGTYGGDSEDFGDIVIIE